MSDVPASIEIGPVVYRVDHTVEGINALRLADENKDIQAYITYVGATITLNPEMAESQKRVSLFHEVLHGALCGLGIHMVNNEDVVTPLAQVLVDTLRRNKALVAYLTSEEGRE